MKTNELKVAYQNGAGESFIPTKDKLPKVFKLTNGFFEDATYSKLWIPRLQEIQKETKSTYKF